MERNKEQEQKCQGGAATVEAIVSFSCFLFVVFTILTTVKYCRAQALISNAVDSAAKELSQYSYFYEMSGLGKVSKALGDNASVGADNINSVVGTLDTFYGTVSSTIQNGQQNGADIYNSFQNRDYDGAVADAQRLLTQTQIDGTNVLSSAESIYNAFSGIKSNPLVYIKSIIAIAGNASLDLFKSRAIAAPLGKLLMEKHFTIDGKTADEALQEIGVDQGLSGMNFNMSTIFTSGAPHQVHLVVYYKLKLFQIFDWAELEVPICKESICDAWLGGDDVLERITPAPAPNGGGN